MLQEAKQLCYDQGQHAIHLIFWTREMINKWSKEFTVLNFRNRRFPVRNTHEVESGTPIGGEERSKVIWGRLMGSETNYLEIGTMSDFSTYLAIWTRRRLMRIFKGSSKGCIIHGKSLPQPGKYPR
ncbi:hypothetical protein PHMEG_00019806 [Phytophthora megakarya]|uniref:Uncharacterized protein n=1 Tax=Phytophthora megakarya TaxID=4795 RepID=A0A225VQZ7_9STRA|nr:hypothetical protein PHMEG_00019806 [Phytophthora megakarya]